MFFVHIKMGFYKNTINERKEGQRDHKSREEETPAAITTQNASRRIHALGWMPVEGGSVVVSLFSLSNKKAQCIEKMRFQRHLLEKWC